MKIVRREGVFETNSSSVHTLVLTEKENWEKEADTKYKKYRVLTDAKDKLYMACGCCHELFPSEKNATESRKEWYARLRELLKDESVYFTLYPENVSCELAVEILVDVYCEKFGGDREKLAAQINAINNSGRGCHMKFFSEGALYDADSDYRLIEQLFYGAVRSEEWGFRPKIVDFFDNGKVLCCREYYQGIGYGED